MLDTTDLRGRAPTRCPQWSRDLRPGVIIAFRFPVDLGGDVARPCLVLDAVSYAGQRFATLAPGFPLLSGRRRRPFDLEIPASDAFPRGVTEPTVFLGAKRLIVSARNSRFVCTLNPDTPVMGWLAPDAMTQLQSLLCRILDEVRCEQERA